MAEYQGYCVKEKQKRVMKDVEIVTNAAGGLNPAFQAGDLLHLALLASSAERVRALLGLG